MRWGVDGAAAREGLIGEAGETARVLVTGSRQFRNAAVVYAALDGIRRRIGEGADPDMLVIHGGARGADRLAGEWAKARGVGVDVFPAEWDRYGPSAGFRRNEWMLREGRPDLVAGFPAREVASNGTRHMLDLAARAGVAVEVAGTDGRMWPFEGAGDGDGDRG